MDERLKAVMKAVHDLQDEEVPLVFAGVPEILPPEDGAARYNVASAFGGTYNMGIVMLTAIINQIKGVTNKDDITILADIYSTLSSCKSEDGDEKSLKVMSVVKGGKDDSDS